MEYNNQLQNGNGGENVNENSQDFSHIQNVQNNIPNIPSIPNQIPVQNGTNIQNISPANAQNIGNPVNTVSGVPAQNIPPVAPVQPQSVPVSSENVVNQIAEKIHNPQNVVNHAELSFFARMKASFSHMFKKKEQQVPVAGLKDLPSQNSQNTVQNFSQPQTHTILEEKKPSWIDTNIPTLGKIIAFFSKKKNHSNTSNSNIQKSTIQIQKTSKGSFFQNWYTFFIGKKDRLHFLDQLSTLLSSDIRLVDGLRLLKQQTTKSSFKKLLDNMIQDIEGGNVLSDSMEKYPRVFPKMWVNLIRAGEASGKLSQILSQLNKQQEDLQRLMGSIKGALVYPGFVVVMLVVLMSVMMTTIVPQIESIYKQARVSLPAITQLIIDTSRFMVENGVAMIIGIIVFIVVSVTLVKKVYFVGKIWDWFNLRWPVFGELNKERSLILFADNVQLLLSSGILIGDALTIAADVVPSVLYREEILRVRNKIRSGSTMSQSMGLIDIAREKFEKNFYFPLEFAQMISVGERTGNLVKVLEKTKNTYSDKVGHTVKNLSTLLEPIMIVIVGGMVGVFLLGIMLPFFGLGQVARGL